ncbi:MAG: hypothetical protein ACP5E4_04710 [Candidatus Aenigmatarchaeota archaeon]
MWSSLNLPPDLEKIPHNEDCTHSYLEINLGDGWKILDATWDGGLKGIFHVNEWDGRSDTEIAVKQIKIFNPQRSLEIVNDQGEEAIKKDLAINGEFYMVFNGWLEAVRKSQP